MRKIDAEDIEAIALGASVYGTGGGGDPYIGKLIAMNMMRRHGPVRMIALDSLADDDLVVPVALVGAPTVAIEKFPSTQQFIGALTAIEKYLGRKASAVMCAEAGGLNSTIPFAVASQAGLPLLDGDLMGRAFPEIQMTLATLHGIKATPMALCDDKGNSVVMNTATNQYTERFVRSLASDMGGSACTVLYPMTGAQARLTTIAGSLTMLRQAGDTLIAARRDKRDPVAALVGLLGARRLFEGKVIDVARATAGGWNRGTATLAGFQGEGRRRCELRFQNEFLLVDVDGKPAATTPDLIAVLDVETGEPVTAELLRYGLRVTVIGFACHPQWRSPGGLALAGPRYFGYDVDYEPIDTLPAGARRPMWEVLLIRLGAFACVPQLLLGSALGNGLSFRGAVWATLLGSVILQLLSVAIGAAACAEGLSTSLLAAWAGFGRLGSALVGAVIAVALMGWFGVQNGVFASGLFHATGWLNVPLWSVFTGLAVTWITVKGYRLMALVARVALPLFLLTVAWAAWRLLAGHSLAELLAATPAGPPLGLPAAITAVTGSFIIGAIVTPDLTRFMRNGREVLWMTVITTFVGELTINLLAVAMALLLRTSDIVTLMSTLAGGIGATIAVVSTVKLNNMNLYSSSLGLSTLVHALRAGRASAVDRVRLTWWIGATSTALSMLGILDHFIGFLVLLGVAIPPIAGIMIVDYTLLRRDRAALMQARLAGTLPADSERVNPVALLAWLLACASALLLPGVGIPALNALLIGSVAYGLCMVVVGRLRGGEIARFAREAAY